MSPHTTSSAGHICFFANTRFLSDGLSSARTLNLFGLASNCFSVWPPIIPLAPVMKTSFFGFDTSLCTSSRSNVSAASIASLVALIARLAIAASPISK